jgi:MFS transporter, Spinster family, sphingosine-1-phosphate transporter
VPAGYARYALGVLFTVNLFNYIDRQILSGVLPLVQQDLRLSDAALGLLASAFMILYLLGAIPLGVLGDRVARPRLIAIGVTVWGAATFLSGLARSYAPLFATRALVGIGEASYGPTATAMVSDLFPKARRGFVNALFNAAIPLGGAIGVALGGLVGTRWGWRAAFLLVGIPSFLLAALVWRLPDPPRGGQDHLARAATPRALGPSLRGLARTPTFVMICAVGMLVAFDIGAFNHWLPLYLYRVKGLTVEEASFWFGILSAAGGVLGVVTGGAVGDFLALRTPAGHLLTIASGFLLSAPFALVLLLSRQPAVYLSALFLAVFFLVLYIGSVNAVIHNVVPPALRATAVAIFVFVVNVGGGALSPFVVGLISARRHSLQAALLMLPILVFFAGLITLGAASVVGADVHRLEAETGD